MTHQGAHLGRSHLNSNRRSGTFPGRRSALVLGLVGVILGCCGGVAQADLPLVQATLYPKSGSVTTTTVMLGELENCTPYPDSDDNLRLYGSNGNYNIAQVTPGYSWALSTVISCGLGQSLSDVTSVVVQRVNGSYEAPLSNADLKDPSLYDDPGAPGALPVVSSDGIYDEDNQYIRPWMGGSDENATDWVPSEGGPIGIQVYENGSPLQVTITPDQLSATTFSFSAAVEDSGGNTIPDSELNWNWSFGDNSAGSSEASPTHTYSISGRVIVGVQATDPSTGGSGPGSIPVTINAQPAGTGTTPQTGGGDTGTTGPATGLQNSNGTDPGGTPGPSSGQPTNQTPHSATTPHSRAPSAAKTKRTHKSPRHTRTKTNKRTSTTGTGGASPGGGGSSAGTANSGSSSTPAANPAAPASAPHTASPELAKPLVPLVRGRLISDITPLAVTVSPLVHTLPASLATAPSVRRAIDPSTAPALIGILITILLFGLGAGRELLRRSSRRTLRFGT